MLSRKGKSLKDIVEVLKVYRANITEEEAVPDGEDASPPQREILGGLINFLEGQ